MSVEDLSEVENYTADQALGVELAAARQEWALVARTLLTHIARVEPTVAQPLPRVVTPKLPNQN